MTEQTGGRKTKMRRRDRHGGEAARRKGKGKRDGHGGRGGGVQKYRKALL